MNLEIYDCTLREGEQEDGASFSFDDRIELCKKLDDFGVDYIELGWPMANKEIHDSFQKAILLCNNAQIVAFGSTSMHKNPEKDINLNSIISCGAKYACIFGKSDLSHVQKQLKLNDNENLKKIYDSIKYLVEKGIHVFYDAEHYFNGFKKNKEYAILSLISAIKAGAKRIVLCDTNGGILPKESLNIIKETKKILNEKIGDVNLGVHFHNDTGLALANTIESLDYIEQVQGTINGIGERIGNLNFSEFLPIYVKKLNNKSRIDLTKLKILNEEAFRLAGLEIPRKRAFVGNSAFAHKGGVHIDAVVKGASYEHANPKEFGNKRIFLMNSLGGKSSILVIAKSFGFELDKNNPEIKEKIKKLIEELKILEKKGYDMGSLKAEQFLLIDKYFGADKKFFQIEEWKIESSKVNNKEMTCFETGCEINQDLFKEDVCIEGGPIEAAFKTFKKLLKNKYIDIDKLSIRDFRVSIARQKKEESTVRTEIYFSDDEEFSTVGVNRNILSSGIEALEKGFKYYLKTKFKN